MTGRPRREVAPPCPEVAEPRGELLAGVLRRAREALLAGRGSEASSLLKATREYVLVQQDVADARDAVDGQIRTWDTAQPARAGELTEAMTLHALHGFWSRLSPAEQAERCDPDGKMGFRAWAEAVEAARGGGGGRERADDDRRLKRIRVLSGLGADRSGSSSGATAYRLHNPDLSLMVCRTPFFWTGGMWALDDARGQAGKGAAPSSGSTRASSITAALLLMVAMPNPLAPQNLLNVLEAARAENRRAVSLDVTAVVRAALAPLVVEGAVVEYLEGQGFHVSTVIDPAKVRSVCLQSDALLLATRVIENRNSIFADNISMTFCIRDHSVSLNSANIYSMTL